MKKALPLTIIVGAILLTSCSFFSTVQSYQEELKLYDLDNIAKSEKNQDIEQGYISSFDVFFVKGEKYIPYLSLEQYGKLFNRFLRKEAHSEFKNDRYSSSWSIYVGEDLYFYTLISTSQKIVIKAGDIENAFDSNLRSRDLKALNYGIKNETSFVLLSDQQYELYDFSEASFHFIRNGGKNYYPLGLLDVSFSESAGTYLFYNYEHLFMTSDVENYINTTYLNNDKQSTVGSDMDSLVSDKIMPQYLVEYNADLFFYLMDNLYGLKSNKKIASMRSFYKSNEIYERLLSTDNIQRGYAYSRALNILDDNHTALINVNDTWHEAHYAPYADGVKARRSLRSLLLTRRQNYYESVLGRSEKKEGDILYSSDNKTAMFHFEEFAFGTSEQVFDAAGEIKNDAYLYDTYFNLVRILSEIKNKGTVENVIIDISTNGGGVVGVMMKLLALISKDNHCSIAFCNGLYKGVSTYNFKIDVNNDGQYSDDETFGKDFNFYLLTSDCSFSCGNAFPCYAQKMGVKIIGEKSGGGECAVAIHYLPNSQYVYHSSNLHLGYLSADQKSFIGLENGASPDIPLNDNKPMCYIEDDKTYYVVPQGFYDIDLLSERIANS